jgi:C1A family cysteine protease
MTQMKSLITILILFFLLSQQAYAAILDTIGGINTLLYGIAAGIAALMITMHAVKWKTAENPSEREEAKRGMINVILALILIMIAATLVRVLFVKPPELPAPPTTTVNNPTTTANNGSFITTTTLKKTSTTTTTKTTTTTSTTTTTLGCFGPCEEYKRTNVLPAAFDWRNVNGVDYMTPVRAQGLCSSCYAHGVLASMESTYNIQQCKSGNTNLAEQDIVSCANDGVNLKGCTSGYTSSTFKWIINNGVCTESCFAYRASDVSCSLKCSSPQLWKVDSYVAPSTTRNDIKAYLICNGPVAAVSNAWAHTVTITGWDDNSNICQSHYQKAGCWIVKNSWGEFTGNNEGVYHVGGYGYVPYSGHSFSDLPSYASAPKGVRAP